MSAISALNSLIQLIESKYTQESNDNERKGAAQSSAALTFKWKDIDKTADRSVLKGLQKYRVLNPDDIRDREKDPNMEDILAKYQSLVNKSDGKNGNKYKLIVLVRHGEGVHNWAKWELFGPEEWKNNQSTDLKWKDPHLTKTGVEQVKKILPKLQCLKHHLNLIVSSPLNRALETATLAFLPLVEIEKEEEEEDDVVIKHKYSIPVYVLEYTRERINHHACDSRNDFDEIKNEWKEYDFEYQGFDTNKDMLWTDKEDENREFLWMRSGKMMQFIFEKDANVVIYSGHCDFIMSLMELILDMPFYKPRNAAFFPLILTTV
mmetsp:Transcript_28294/g.24995  ORF Transcript_28294/g.24995 Transcript_28294/m.24995 type:complete len:320 (+) Transcript_28294:37-996(+)